MKHLYFAVIILLPLLPRGQDSPDKQLALQIDQSVTETFKNFTPGCVVLVANKGQVILEKAYGSANLELQVPMQTDMLFRIGSITKEFTAVAILQLADRGELALTDTLGKYLPGFGDKGKNITIENLLTHTSGIKGYEQIDVKIPNAIRIDFPPERVIDSLSRLNLDFEPGTKFAYSNSNYFILGFLIEKITGMAYADYLKKNILLPAGMKSTVYESFTNIIPNRVSGYSYTDGQYKNAEFLSMSLVYSAGALRSTAADLFKWHQSLWSANILLETTFNKAIRPYTLKNGMMSDYGYGFFIRPQYGALSIGHGGAIDGFRAQVLFYPRQDIYIAVLSNSDQEGNEQIFANIARLMLGVQITGNTTDQKQHNDILDSYVGTYRNDKYKVNIKLYRANGGLYGDLSNGTGSYLKFEALPDGSFLLPDIKRTKTTARFITENNRVAKLVMQQGESIVFDKIQ